MKARLKQVLITGLMVMGMGMWAQKAHAGTSDGMTVNVTPGNVAYGVTIASGSSAGYDFQTVNLGQTTVSTRAVSVTNSGTISEYFVMAIGTTTSVGGDNWVPVGADNATPGTDAFELLGLFQTHLAATPGYASFVSSTFIPGTALGAGGSSYGQGTLHQTTASTLVDLWLALRMPAGESISDATNHQMQLTITGQQN